MLTIRAGSGREQSSDVENIASGHEEWLSLARAPINLFLLYVFRGTTPIEDLWSYLSRKELLEILMCCHDCSSSLFCLLIVRLGHLT